MGGYEAYRAAVDTIIKENLPKIVDPQREVLHQMF
jgi:hypothetical protein